MKESRNELVLLMIVLVIAAALIYKTVKWPLAATVHVTLVQQNAPIANLDMPRKPLATREFSVDVISFPETMELEHPNIGKLGASSNFFMTLRTNMIVKKSGIYRFSIVSDDGFRLKIDNHTICEHPGDRPMQESMCSTTLQEKAYQLELEYFQGGGPMGLKARYGYKHESLRYYIGESSDAVLFEELQ